jgi:hypothetical protein
MTDRSRRREEDESVKKKQHEATELFPAPRKPFFQIRKATAAKKPTKPFIGKRGAADTPTA